MLNERSGRGTSLGVSCGLWVPLMWCVCGRELPWALQPLVSVYWRLSVSLVVCGCL